MTLLWTTLIKIADGPAVGLILVHMIGGVCRTVMRIGFAVFVGLVLRLMQVFDVGAQLVGGVVIMRAHTGQRDGWPWVPVRPSLGAR